jgi:U3 small nucleolar RNA-associated protein 22
LHKAHKITVPFTDPKPDKSVAYKLAYAKPSSVNVIGSYTLKTMVKSDSTLSIDMLVVMPASIFQEKDYLNYRYFHKRAYYVACIAAGLQQSVQEEYNLNFEHLHGNDLHPILSLKPKCGKTARSERSNVMLRATSRWIEVSEKLLHQSNSWSAARIVCGI